MDRLKFKLEKKQLVYVYVYEKLEDEEYNKKERKRMNSILL